MGEADNRSAGAVKLSRRRSMNRVAWLYISRYPFINAVVLLMLLGEKLRESGSDVNLSKEIIIGHVVVMSIIGSALCFKFKPRFFANVAAFYHGFSTLLLVCNTNFSEIKKVQLASKALAVMGAFLVLSSGLVFPGEVRRSKPRFLSVARIFLGLHLFISAYLLISSEQMMIISKLVPYVGYYVALAIAGLLALSSFSFITAQYINVFAKIGMGLFAMIILAEVVGILFRSLWTFDFFYRVYLLSGSVCCLVAMFMYSM